MIEMEPETYHGEKSGFRSRSGMSTSRMASDSRAGLRFLEHGGEAEERVALESPKQMDGSLVPESLPRSDHDHQRGDCLFMPVAITQRRDHAIVLCRQPDSDPEPV
ncbi:hypothetical protein ACAX61_13755 [Sphingomonas sp. IW22]|jgi:hypothetical protein